MFRRQRILSLFLIVSCVSVALSADESGKFYLRLNRPSLPEIYEGRLPGNVAVPELPAGTLLVLDRTQYDGGYFTGTTLDNKIITFRVSTQDGTLSSADSSEVQFTRNPNLLFNRAVYVEGNSDSGRAMRLWYQVIDRTTGEAYRVDPAVEGAKVIQSRAANQAAAPPTPPSVPDPSQPAGQKKTEGAVCAECVSSTQKGEDILSKLIDKLVPPDPEHPFLKTGDALDDYLARFRSDCKLPKEYFDKYKPNFAAAEKSFGIPKEFLACLALRESRLEHDVSSSTGAVGLMQFTEPGAAEIQRIIKLKLEPAYSGALKYFGGEDKLPKTFSKHEENSQVVIGASGMLLAHYWNFLDEKSFLNSAMLTDENQISALSILAAGYNMGNGAVLGVVRQFGNIKPSGVIEKIKTLSPQVVAAMIKKTALGEELRRRSSSDQNFESLLLAKAHELKGHVSSIKDCMSKNIDTRFGVETASESKCKK